MDGEEEERRGGRSVFSTSSMVWMPASVDLVKSRNSSERIPTSWLANSESAIRYMPRKVKKSATR